MTKIRSDIDSKKVVLLYRDKNKTIKDIANIFGCSVWKIDRILRENNIVITRAKIRKTIENEIDKIVKMYNNGISTTKIAEIYDCHRDYVRRILKQNGINTSTKISIDKNIINDLIFVKQYSMMQLCGFFKCTKSTIRRSLLKHNINRLPHKYEKDMLNGEKQCNSCDKIKSIKNFGKRRLSSDAITIVGSCKECISIINKKNRKETKSKNKDKKIVIKSKKCSVCHKTKNINNFSKCSVNPDGLKYECKMCCGKNFKKYVERYPEKVAHRSKQRRDMEKGLKNYYPIEYYNITLDIFKNKCFSCGANKNLTIDHHLPLSKRNALTIRNAVLLCKSCNSSKKDRLPKDFYTKSKLSRVNKILNKAQKIFGQ